MNETGIQHSSMSPPAGPKQVRVLVVEDERPLRRAFAVNLQQREYTVSDAPGLATALAARAGPLPDVIVLDVNLPDGSGWDLLRTLAGQGGRMPAVVAMSAAMPAKARMAEFCPAAFLPRPFPISALPRAVDRAVTGEATPREHLRHSSL